VDGVRRVVTGLSDGVSVVACDERLPHDQRVLWRTDPLPVDGRSLSKPTERSLQVDIPAGVGIADFAAPGTTRFAIVTIEPDEVVRARLGSAFDDDQYGMHQTQSIDYVVILRGEIWLKLDREEVHLRAGDCVVQRGTRHAWRNHGDLPCVFAATVLGASPTPHRALTPGADVGGSSGDVA
jgi:mannose-6-phosphate isomerase-like protein (cupin superfamily)